MAKDKETKTIHLSNRDLSQAYLSPFPTANLEHEAVQLKHDP